MTQSILETFGNFLETFGNFLELLPDKMNQEEFVPAVAVSVHRDVCELNYHQALLDSVMCPLVCTGCVISLAK